MLTLSEINEILGDLESEAILWGRFPSIDEISIEELLNREVDCYKELSEPPIECCIEY